MGLRMDFKWTEEDHRRYSVIFSQARLWPAPGPGYFTTDKWKLWANLGLLGLSVPEAYGGEQLRREVLLRLSSGEWIGANAIAEEGVGSVVYAVTQPDLGYLGMSAFVVERATPGLTIGEPFGKLGLDRCPADTLWFDRCVVPARWRLGAEGRGAAIFQDAMRWERTCLFAAYVGHFASHRAHADVLGVGSSAVVAGMRMHLELIVRELGS